MRFETWLRDLVAKESSVTSVSLVSESGGAKTPYGHRMSFTDGSQFRTHVLGQFRDGDKYGEAEEIVEADSPITGAAVPALDGKATPEWVEAWLAAVIAASGSRELTGITRYSPNGPGQAMPYGLTIDCASMAKVYVYIHKE